MSPMQSKDITNRAPTGGIIVVTSANDAQVSAHLQSKQPGEFQPPRRVLIVEDDASLAHLEAEILMAHGFQVTIANNGEQAITTLRHSIPDIVVLDLELPNILNGWDVLQVLRS